MHFDFDVFGANAPSTIIDKYRFRSLSNTIPNQRAILFKQQRTANITVKHLPVTYFSHNRLQTPDP
ncbi:hypothetical protein T12_12872 [Trichinella patagoniensis]|uniref:Uncharacterized protein n=1 Tax=Trichinella patagoniensis TaxID=990121 RepID=A0A0V0ZNA8_9BILA|nr:hypothetical protein T12_12872 [Trichinella patagoniensis]